MEESPTYTDLDAESSPKYTNLDTFDSSRATHGQQLPQMPGSSQSSNYHYGTGPTAPYQQPPGTNCNLDSSYYSNSMIPVPRYPNHPTPNASLSFQPQSTATTPSYVYPSEHGHAFQNPPQNQYPMSAMGMPANQQHTPQQYPPNVNHQYLSQLHSEIEYYKNEINKMYVMPPSPDLAAKIRDFQNRVSYLEDKKHYLSMNTTQAPLPSYSHGTQNPQSISGHDASSYPRMTYPPHETSSYSSVQNYRNQCAYPPANPNYMFDKTATQGSGYQQPYGNYSGHASTQPLLTVAVRPAVQPPPGNYPNAGPAPGYANPYTTHVQPNQTHYGSSMPAVSNLPNITGHSGYGYQDPSLAGKSNASVPVEQVVQPPVAKPTSDSNKITKHETNPTKQPPTNDRPKVAYTPQATSFVSSFVQNAFKTKENANYPCAIANEPVMIDKVNLRPMKPEDGTPVSGTSENMKVENSPRPEPEKSERISTTTAVEVSKANVVRAELQSSVSENAGSVPKGTEEDFKSSRTNTDSLNLLMQSDMDGSAKLLEQENSNLEAPISGQPVVSTLQSLKAEISAAETTSKDVTVQPDTSTKNNEKRPPKSLTSDNDNFEMVPSSSCSTSPNSSPRRENVRRNQPEENPFSTNSSSSLKQDMEKHYDTVHNTPPSFDPTPVIVSAANQSMASVYSGTSISGPPMTAAHVAPLSRPAVPIYQQPGFNPGAQHVPHSFPPPVPVGPHVRGPLPPAGPYTGHWVASSGQVHASPWVTTTSYPAIAPAGPLPPRQPAGPIPIAPRCHLKKSAMSSRANHTPDGKRIRKKKKETEEAVPDSTTSELGEPITSTCDTTSRTDIQLIDQGSPYEEPTSSQTDILGSTTSKPARKKKTDGGKRPRKGKRVKDNNEAEGIDVSSATLSSLELNSNFMESNPDTGSHEQELPSPSKTENCPSSKSSGRRPCKKLATKIGLNKKKRKRFDSSDDDLMPPVEASLIPEEFVEKRRSERNTGE